MSFPEVKLKLKNGLFPRWVRWTKRARRWWKLEKELLPQVGGNEKYLYAWEYSLEFWPITVSCPQLKFALQGLEACGPGRPYAGIGEAIQVLWLLWLGLLHIIPHTNTKQAYETNLCRSIAKKRRGADLNLFQPSLVMALALTFMDHQVSFWDTPTFIFNFC